MHMPQKEKNKCDWSTECRFMTIKLIIHPHETRRKITKVIVSKTRFTVNGIPFGSTSLMCISRRVCRNTLLISIKRADIANGIYFLFATVI